MLLIVNNYALKVMEPFLKVRFSGMINAVRLNHWLTENALSMLRLIFQIAGKIRLLENL